MRGLSGEAAAPRALGGSAGSLFAPSVLLWETSVVMTPFPGREVSC